MKNQLSIYLLVTGLVFGFTGCGGGSAGSNGGSTESPAAVSLSSLSSSFASSSPGFVVSAIGGAGGVLTPAIQTVPENGSASVTVSADTGYRLSDINGCDGNLSGSIYTTGKTTSACAINANFAPVEHTIGGVTSGVNGSLQLTYQFETGSETLTIVQDGSFNFAQLARLDSSYQITVATQPADQTCSVMNGSGKVASNVTDIAVTCERGFSVSGTITPAGKVTIDSDVNDILAPFADNSITSQAQSIHRLAEVQGFASAQATGGDATLERFALTADPDDIFTVTLAAGQVIQLQVVDYKSVADGGNAADLDLYLFDADSQLAGVSELDGEFDELVAPASKVYFIHIHAHSASSKYVLRLWPASTISSAVSAPPEFVPNEMIVRYVDQTTKISTTDKSGGRANTSRRPGLEPIDGASFGQNRAMAAMKRANRTAYDKVATLRSIKRKTREPGVVYAEPNYIRKGLVTPNDPHYALQWHYAAIGLPDAWNITTGSGIDQSVIVAVVDTGIALAHPDMFEQTVAGYDFISNADRARDGDGIENDPNDPGDSDKKGESSWHGTHVGGTVAAASNNGTGVAGVSWGAKIMPVRVLGKDGGTSYDIIQGLRYAASLANDSNTLPQKKADIANLSYGGAYGSRAEREAYQEVRAAGVILVAAAGNSASSELLYPAAYPEVISVSATDYSNKLAPYSSFGSTVALAAPGGNSAADLNDDGQPDGVLSAAADDSKGALRYIYRFYNGTSMAAPHVAGVLALMKAVYPALTPDTVDALIQDGSISDDLGISGRDDNYGYGFINAFKAVSLASQLAAGTQLPKEALPNVTATPSQLDLGILSNADISLSNQGGGDPVVTSVSDNIEWLAVNPNVVDSNGLGSYSLTVNRSDLSNGAYQGEVVFGLNNGTAVTVAISMEVDAMHGVGELSQLYVFLIESETLAVAAGIHGQGQGDGSVNYTFPAVAAGTYYVVAGSDIDADGLTCQPGEMCGAYFGLEQPQKIELMDTDKAGIDFSADILESLSGTAPYLQLLARP